MYCLKFEVCKYRPLIGKFIKRHSFLSLELAVWFSSVYVRINHFHVLHVFLSKYRKLTVKER